MGDMKSLLEPEFRLGRLDVKEYQLRSALSTSQQVSRLKGSAEFARWCDRQRTRRQSRQQAATLLQIVIAVTLLLLGYSLAKPQVKSPSNAYVMSCWNSIHYPPDLSLLY